MFFMCDGSRLSSDGRFGALAAFLLAGCGGGGGPQRRQVAEAKVPVIAVHAGAVMPRSMLGGLIVPFQNVQITTTLVEPADAVYVSGRRPRPQGPAARATRHGRSAGTTAIASKAPLQSDAANTKKTSLQAGLTIIQNKNSIDAAQAALRQVQQTLATDTVPQPRSAHC